MHHHFAMTFFSLTEENRFQISTDSFEFRRLWIISPDEAFGNHCSDLEYYPYRFHLHRILFKLFSDTSIRNVFYSMQRKHYFPVLKNNSASASFEMPHNSDVIKGIINLNIFIYFHEIRKYDFP